MKLASYILLVIAFFIACTCQAQSEDVQAVYADLNRIRIEHGLQPLAYLSQRQAACDRWAYQISESLRHDNNERYLGEAISECPVSASLIVPLFIDSHAHKSILLNKRAKGVCIGIYYVAGSTIITENSEEIIPPIYYTVLRVY